MINPEDSLAAFAEALTPAQRDLITARTKSEFDDAFATIILEAVERLERDSNGFAELNEDTLSSIFVGFVNGTNALTATREEYSNGHVDMTFHARLCKPARAALGEAKIFNYYEWHEEGLSQLMTRYSTGREERGLLVVYFKKKDIKSHIDSLKLKLDEVLPFDQVSPCGSHPARWSFLSTHKHSSGELLEVWHLGCNLYTPKSKT